MAEDVTDPPDAGANSPADLDRLWKACFDGIASGTPGALEALYDAAAQEIFGLALWRTGSRDAAADVVQDVFVKLAESRHRLSKITKPRAWLLSVAHNLAVDAGRRQRRRATEPLEHFPLLTTREGDAGRTVDAARASQLLTSLPAAQRDAIYLHHFAGCSFAEIGAVTGVPTFTAASRYRLGIRRLRLLIEGKK